MPKSFVKFKPVSGSSEKHNQREQKPKYLIPADTRNVHIGDQSIAQVRKAIEEKYKATVGQKMQKKATPIREAVILLPNDDNRANKRKLFDLTDKLEEKYGIRAFQWHIHNDEGHIDKTTGKKNFNYHAHVVFDWTDPNTGKSLKLDKKDLSEIQTITADTLGMERGIKGSKSLSLNHHEFRGYLQIKDKLEKEFKKELSQKQEIEIRKEIINKRPKNLDKDRGFDL